MCNIFTHTARQVTPARLGRAARQMRETPGTRPGPSVRVPVPPRGRRQPSPARPPTINFYCTRYRCCRRVFSCYIGGGDVHGPAAAVDPSGCWIFTPFCSAEPYNYRSRAVDGYSRTIIIIIILYVTREQPVVFLAVRARARSAKRYICFVSFGTLYRVESPLRT